MEHKKTVLIPIEVPTGDYCWDHAKGFIAGVSCRYYDSEGAHSTCTLPFGYRCTDTEKGALKDPTCAALHTKKEG